MRTLHTLEIQKAVTELLVQANCSLTKDVEQGIKKAQSEEKNPLGQRVLSQLLENARLAEEKTMALCQDTGMVVVFLEIGQEVKLEGPYLEDAVQEGVRLAYTNFFFRKSVVTPLARENSGDNTPAVIHTRIVKGTSVSVSVAPKGFGSENMSSLKMLKPSQGIEGVKRFVLDTVSEAGGNPCPPIVVGVGIGGTMEKAAQLAKEALLRPVDEEPADPFLQELEAELLDKVNQLGIGSQGYGGTVTALSVNIKTYPTHIAGLPVAVNINCHVSRHASRVLE